MMMIKTNKTKHNKNTSELSGYIGGEMKIKLLIVTSVDNQFSLISSPCSMQNIISNKIKSNQINFIIQKEI
jgi:hypothetical protein